jgi:hypothetical protein
VRRAGLKAGQPIWRPLRLRPSAGTAIRRQYGLEAFSAMLGHCEWSVTPVDNTVNWDTARRVTAEIGRCHGLESRRGLQFSSDFGLAG